MTASASQVAQTCTVKYRIYGDMTDHTVIVGKHDGFPNEVDLRRVPFAAKPERWHLELVAIGWILFRRRHLADHWEQMATEYRKVTLYIAHCCGIADAMQDHENKIRLTGTALVDRYIEKYVLRHPEPDKVGPFLAWRGTDSIYAEFREGDPRVAEFISAYSEQMHMYEP